MSFKHIGITEIFCVFTSSPWFLCITHSKGLVHCTNCVSRAEYQVQKNGSAGAVRNAAVTNET